MLEKPRCGAVLSDIRKRKNTNTAHRIRIRCFMEYIYSQQDEYIHAYPLCRLHPNFLKRFVLCLLPFMHECWDPQSNVSLKRYSEHFFFCSQNAFARLLLKESDRKKYFLILFFFSPVLLNMSGLEFELCLMSLQINTLPIRPQRLQKER